MILLLKACLSIIVIATLSFFGATTYNRKIWMHLSGWAMALAAVGRAMVLIWGSAI